MSLKRRLERLEQAARAREAELMAFWVGQYDRIRDTVCGAWGDEVRRLGLTPLAALDAGRPPLPDLFPLSPHVAAAAVRVYLVECQPLEAGQP